MAYPNLMGEIAKRGIRKKAIAASIGVCPRSLANKMCGKAPFTWPEVQKIKTQFFPDMELDDLLRKVAARRREGG